MYICVNTNFIFNNMNNKYSSHFIMDRVSYIYNSDLIACDKYKL